MQSFWQWWIEVEAAAPSSRIRAGQLPNFGPFETEAEALDKIAELKTHPRFSGVGLVTKKRRKP